MKSQANILFLSVLFLPQFISVLSIFSSVESNYYHIGTWNHPDPNNTHSKHEAASFYFLSQEKADWNEAEKNCKTNVGIETHLICIETEKEYQAICKFLRKTEDTKDPSFWVGGGYSVDAGKYFWLNGEELGNWVQWIDSNPSPVPVSTRVALKQRKNATLFQSKQDNTKYMYICELEVP